MCVLFNPLSAYPLPHPENFDLGRLCVGVFLCVRRRGRGPLQSTTNGWFGHEEQGQGAMWNFNCTTLRKKKKKESALRMKLRYKLKFGGLLVCLSHFCWRPRILLYNGLSTFFYYNIIYLNFLSTKQNPGTTDQRCQNRLGASLFVFVFVLF